MVCGDTMAHRIKIPHKILLPGGSGVQIPIRSWQRVLCVEAAYFPDLKDSNKDNICPRSPAVSGK